MVLHASKNVSIFINNVSELFDIYQLTYADNVCMIKVADTELSVISLAQLYKMDEDGIIKNLVMYSSNGYLAIKAEIVQN